MPDNAYDSILETLGIGPDGNSSPVSAPPPQQQTPAVQNSAPTFSTTASAVTPVSATYTPQAAPEAPAFEDTRAAQLGNDPGMDAMKKAIARQIAVAQARIEHVSDINSRWHDYLPDYLKHGRKAKVLDDSGKTIQVDPTEVGKYRDVIDAGEVNPSKKAKAMSLLGEVMQFAVNLPNLERGYIGVSDPWSRARNRAIEQFQAETPVINNQMTNMRSLENVLLQQQTKERVASASDESRSYRNQLAAVKITNEAELKAQQERIEAGRVNGYLTDVEASIARKQADAQLTQVKAERERQVVAAGGSQRALDAQALLNLPNGSGGQNLPPAIRQAIQYGILDKATGIGKFLPKLSGSSTITDDRGNVVGQNRTSRIALPSVGGGPSAVQSTPSPAVNGVPVPRTSVQPPAANPTTRPSSSSEAPASAPTDDYPNYADPKEFWSNPQRGPGKISAATDKRIGDSITGLVETQTLRKLLDRIPDDKMGTFAGNFYKYVVQKSGYANPDLSAFHTAAEIAAARHMASIALRRKSFIDQVAGQMSNIGTNRNNLLAGIDGYEKTFKANLRDTREWSKSRVLGMFSDLPQPELKGLLKSIYHSNSTETPDYNSSKNAGTASAGTSKPTQQAKPTLTRAELEAEMRRRGLLK